MNKKEIRNKKNIYVNEIAILAGVSKTLVWYWVRIGIIPKPRHKKGRAVYWRAKKVLPIIDDIIKYGKYLKPTGLKLLWQGKLIDILEREKITLQNAAKNMKKPLFITVADFARKTKQPYSRIRYWIQQGLLPPLSKKHSANVFIATDSLYYKAFAIIRLSEYLRVPGIRVWMAGRLIKMIKEGDKNG